MILLIDASTDKHRISVHGILHIGHLLGFAASSPLLIRAAKCRAVSIDIKCPHGFNSQTAGSEST